MTVLVTDRQSYQITHREFTDEGFLKVPGRVARSGVQKYLASELGLTDRKPHDVVNVYRPPEEVFAADSLATYANADVTNEHPRALVNADTYKDVSVGHTASQGYADGDYVVADLLIKDKDAIQAVQDGKASLSAGYKAEYHYEPGQTTDGTSYEFVQRDIRINHIALVDQARAGPEARLYDTQPREAKPMATVTLDNGQKVELEDGATAQLLQTHFDSLAQKVADAEAAKQTAETEKEEEKAKREKMAEEYEDMEKKSSDEAISERVKAVNDAMESARKVAGSDFTCDSVDVPTIQRRALEKARPSMDWSDKSDAYVQAAWDLEMSKSTEDAAHDSHKGVADDLRRTHSNDADVMDGTAAYQNFLNQAKTG